MIFRHENDLRLRGFDYRCKRDQYGLRHQAGVLGVRRPAHSSLHREIPQYSTTSTAMQGISTDKKNIPTS